MLTWLYFVKLFYTVLLICSNSWSFHEDGKFPAFRPWEGMHTSHKPIRFCIFFLVQKSLRLITIFWAAGIQLLAAVSYTHRILHSLLCPPLYLGLIVLGSLHIMYIGSCHNCWLHALSYFTEVYHNYILTCLYSILCAIQNTVMCIKYKLGVPVSLYTDELSQSTNK